MNRMSSISRRRDRLMARFHSQHGSANDDRDHLAEHAFGSGEDLGRERRIGKVRGAAQRQYRFQRAEQPAILPRLRATAAA